MFSFWTSLLVTPPNGIRNLICAASTCQFSAFASIQHFWFPDYIMKPQQAVFNWFPFRSS
jgi:hypothetical protein